MGPALTRPGGNTASYRDVPGVSSANVPKRELFRPVPGIIGRSETHNHGQADPTEEAYLPRPGEAARSGGGGRRRSGGGSEAPEEPAAAPGTARRAPAPRTRDRPPRPAPPRELEYLRKTLRREPTPEEIADATKLSLEVVQSLAALNTGDVRLDAPLDPDGDRSLIERFIAEDLPDTEDQAMDRFLSDEIESALNTLQRRDAKVLRLYFGLDGGREHTLEEIGGMLGVTPERVRPLPHRALKRLRAADCGQALASFAA